MVAKTITVVESPTGTTQKSSLKVNGLQTYLLISKADRAAQALIYRTLRPMKLTPSEWLLLGLVTTEDEEGLSPGDLARQLYVSAAQATSISSKLIDRRLLRQKTSRQDRRGRTLQVTAKGRTLFDDANSAVDAALQTWLRPIPANYLTFYRRVLQAMTGSSK